MKINPSAECGRHLHDNAVEVIRCDSGKILLDFGKQKTTLLPGEHFLVPQATEHEVINPISKISEATIVYNSIDRNYTAISGEQ